MCVVGPEPTSFGHGRMSASKAEANMAQLAVTSQSDPSRLSAAGGNSVAF